MLVNSILVGVFCRKYKILSFLEFLKSRFNIDLDKVFVYEISGNDNEYLVTFKSSKRNNWVSQIKGATIMHVKNGCLFSINALNVYINNENKENIPNEQYKVNWDILKNKLLLLTNGELKIKDLIKMEDKAILFK